MKWPCLKGMGSRCFSKGNCLGKRKAKGAESHTSSSHERLKVDSNAISHHELDIGVIEAPKNSDGHYAVGTLNHSTPHVLEHSVGREEENERRLSNELVNFQKSIRGKEIERYWSLKELFSVEDKLGQAFPGMLLSSSVSTSSTHSSFQLPSPSGRHRPQVTPSLHQSSFNRHSTEISGSHLSLETDSEEVGRYMSLFSNNSSTINPQPRLIDDAGQGQGQDCSPVRSVSKEGNQIKSSELSEALQILEEVGRSRAAINSDEHFAVTSSDEDQGVHVDGKLPEMASESLAASLCKANSIIDAVGRLTRQNIFSHPGQDVDVSKSTTVETRMKAHLECQLALESNSNNDERDQVSSPSTSTDQQLVDGFQNTRGGGESSSSTRNESLEAMNTSKGKDKEMSGGSEELLLATHHGSGEKPSIVRLQLRNDLDDERLVSAPTRLHDSDHADNISFESTEGSGMEAVCIGLTLDDVVLLYENDELDEEDLLAFVNTTCRPGNEMLQLKS
eukprot:Gb_39530 [translate_table: standard]